VLSQNFFTGISDSDLRRQKWRDENGGEGGEDGADFHKTR
jgi:hypothetical protein